MLVSTKGRYALRTMVDLAVHGDGEPVKIKDIANRQGISGKYLEQIISILSRAGYVPVSYTHLDVYKRQGLSLTVMGVCKKFRLFGMVGVSILGGVAHNIGQFLMAAFVVNTFGVFAYLPVLLAAGTVAGALIGLLGGMVVQRISRVFREI